MTIDEIIKKYSKIKWKKISPWILNILRMGIYQIIYLEKIPKRAIVKGIERTSRYLTSILGAIIISAILGMHTAPAVLLPCGSLPVQRMVLAV